MARKEKKYHYIYKTTCNVTGRWYIGMHSTDDLNDGYIGSGKRLWFSINYHGKENHTKEIIEFCENRFELKKREAEVVNEQLLLEDLCMNLTTGGQGGIGNIGGFKDEEHQQKCSKAGKIAFNYKLKNDEDFRNSFSDKATKRNIRLINEGVLKNWKENYDWNGKKHSDETKNLISQLKQGTGIGETNSQYGTCWITRDGLNKKVKKELLNIYLEEGWVKGRK